MFFSNFSLKKKIFLNENVQDVAYIITVKQVHFAENRTKVKTSRLAAQSSTKYAQIIIKSVHFYFNFDFRFRDWSEF